MIKKIFLVIKMTSFRTFLLALVSLASAGTALASSWQMSDVKVTTLCGVSAISGQEVYAAMSDNALGPGVIHSTDACKTSEYIGPAGGMNMDIAFTPAGVAGCMATVSGLQLTQDGKTFHKVSDLIGVSQNVEAFGSSSFGATGTFTSKTTKKSVNGVAVSSNYGTTWDIYDIGLGEGYTARYGAFPTATTWYVSSGSWPYDASAAKAEHKMSARLNVFNKDGKKTTEYTQPKTKSLRSSTVTGYPGAISKTTDGGKTWTKVFDSNGSMYFNEIHCNDEQNCMAVAENDGELLLLYFL